MRPARLLPVLGCLALALHAQQPAPGNVLSSCNYLKTGEYLVSSNQAFFAHMQPDGNFCVYAGSSPTARQGPAIWCSGTSGPGGKFFAIVHPNGNFCVAPGDGPGPDAALWCTNQVADRGTPSYAVMNGDGDFIVNTGTPAQPTGLLWHHGITFSQVQVTAPAAGGAVRWPDGATCPPTCHTNQRVGSSLSLTAVPPPNFAFGQWSGACSGTANPCVLTVAAGGLQSAAAEFTGPTCPSGQVPLDRQTCVTLTRWQPPDPLPPEGTRVVVQLATAYRSSQQPFVSWAKYLGLAPNDNTTIDATDTELWSRNLFTLRTTRSQYGMAWFSLRAANGMYVAKPPGQDVPTASFGPDDAGLFSLYGEPINWFLVAYQLRWRDIPAWTWRQDAEQQFTSISPQTYNLVNIGNWPDLHSTGYPIRFFLVGGQ